MNRIIRSRLSIIAVVLILPITLAGCHKNCDLCAWVCTPLVVIPWFIGVIICVELLCPNCVFDGDSCPVSLTQLCEEHPDECTAAWTQMQLTAIQICEEYPDECQQAFDTWAESFQEEDTE